MTENGSDLHHIQPSLEEGANRFMPCVMETQVTEEIGIMQDASKLTSGLIGTLGTDDGLPHCL